MRVLFLLLFVNSLEASGQARNLIFVFLNNKTDKTELATDEDKIMSGHRANIERLAKEGKLIVAGPFDGGGGIFIFNSSSQDSVRKWLSSDPGVKANRWNIEILPYTPRVGSVCVAPKPYVMVSYEFIRYTATFTKDNVQRAPETARMHDEYLKKINQTGNVIEEGLFGEDGGILVMRGELQKGVIEADPSMMDGLYQIEFKKLYVARGAFCERE